MSSNTFRVFYRDYAHDVSIKSTKPEALAADRLTALADTLLVSENNFFGILDSSDVILQFYLEDDGDIVAELIYPDADGCFRLKMSRQEAMIMLAGLPPAFSENLLPGGQYIG